MNEIHQRVFKIWGLINFNTKTLTLWFFYENSKSVTLTPRSPQGWDGADKNFRPISTIMPNMNEIHQRVFKIWGLINFNAKTLTLWWKDERTNVRTNERTYERTNGRTEKRKLYTPTYFVCRGYNKTAYVPNKDLYQPAYWRRLQSLRCPSEDAMDLWLPIEWHIKTLIRLPGCADWPESSLVAHLEL